MSAATRFAHDGSFQLTNVPPGEYVLDVQQRPQNIRNLQDINLSQLEFASMPLSVSGRYRQSHRRDDRRA